MIRRTQGATNEANILREKKNQFHSSAQALHNMDNILTQKMPAGMVVAQTVGITASMFLFGKLPLPWIYPMRA